MKYLGEVEKGIHSSSPYRDLYFGNHPKTDWKTDFSKGE
jgi:hypothetical protein